MMKGSNITTALLMETRLIPQTTGTTTGFAGSLIDINIPQFLAERFTATPPEKHSGVQSILGFDPTYFLAS